MHFSKSIPKNLNQSIDGLIKQFSLHRVLVAFSGGPDSQALLYFLSFWRNVLEIGVAHVDHNWREESTDEAKVLKKQVEALGFPFYLKTLDPKNLTGNIEQACRNERYAFFKEICDLENYQAVFVGHHRDDLAETILKRILEGASLTAMRGIQKNSTMNGTLILRPMLDISKKDLIQMLQDKNIPFIDDKTNLDPRFLRGKFRKTILPALNEDFGKSVTEPLVRLGQECVELTEFMKSRFKDHLNQKKMLDFSSIETKFEIKWLVGTWLKTQGLNPSYAVLDDIAEKKSDTRYLIEGRSIEVDRGRLFVADLPSLSRHYLLNDGSGKWNGWNIQIDELLSDEKEVVGWQACWNGKIQFHLPDGDFSFIHYSELKAEEKKMLQKQWANEKIPAFFRHFVPVVSKGDCLIREFLLSSKRSASTLGNCTKKVILYLE